jgi:hypothetical protein
MHVYRILLEKRPPGSTIVSAETDLPFKNRIKPGCTVTLRFREVRILAQVVDLDEDEFFLGQVVDLDGMRRETDQQDRPMWPELQGLQIGTYLRFREDHIFACQINY